MDQLADEHSRVEEVELHVPDSDNDDAAVEEEEHLEIDA
jgi:hypothetical protein